MARATTSKTPPEAGGAKTKAKAGGKPAWSRPPREPVIYLGPHLPGGAVSRGQVFRGGAPALPSDQDQEILAPLFIPLGRLVRARRELADPSSELSRAYRAAADHIGR